MGPYFWLGRHTPTHFQKKNFPRDQQIVGQMSSSTLILIKKGLPNMIIIAVFISSIHFGQSPVPFIPGHLYDFMISEQTGVDSKPLLYQNEAEVKCHYAVPRAYM